MSDSAAFEELLDRYVTKTILKCENFVCTLCRLFEDGKHVREVVPGEHHGYKEMLIGGMFDELNSHIYFKQIAKYKRSQDGKERQEEES